MGSDELQGTLDLLALKTIARSPLHGYGIVQRIQQISGGALRVEEGSLYPALHRMEMAGWIDAEWKPTDTGRRAKYYHLTPAGRRRLAEAEDNWGRVTKAVTKVLKHA
ncbi:MAG TPA: PadR family transcriptional regulator [Blastocatellia bacterium]|nr:PadR family transcriptional regulator [Blastocatellia bacterium]